MATQKKKAVSKRKKPPAKPNGRPTKLTQPVADRIAEGVSLGMTFKEAAKAGGIHEDTLDSWRKRGAAESNTIYTRFLGQIDRAAEKTAITYLGAIRQSIMESPVKVREHIKKDESGKVIMKEIHRETLPPDIKGAMWWLERRFPEQFGRRDQMEHTGKVHAVQTQERKLTIELVKSDGEVHRLTRDDALLSQARQVDRGTPALALSEGHLHGRFLRGACGALGARGAGALGLDHCPPQGGLAAGTTWPPRWCLPARCLSEGTSCSPSAQPLTSA